MAKNLGKDLLGIGVDTIFAGTTINILDQSPLPGPIRTGTGALIGAGLLKKTSKKLDLEDIY